MRSVPTRVVLNFANRCALNCEWCYVPFGLDRASHEVMKAIVDRVASLNFEVITFGGGDPFQYRYIGSLAEQAKAAGLFVHIDTHGKALKKTKENELLLRQHVNLLGLPIDGPSTDIHDAMRTAPGHFKVVLEKAIWARDIGVTLKINTMISKANISSLLDIGQLVNKLSPARWSIYQYMAIGPGSKVSDNHLLDPSAFSRAVSEVLEIFSADGHTIVEAADAHSRRQTYPIIHHDGSLFLHSDDAESGMIRVGSIFDCTARSSIDAVCGKERELAFTRYKSSSDL